MTAAPGDFPMPREYRAHDSHRRRMGRMAMGAVPEREPERDESPSLEDQIDDEHHTEQPQAERCPGGNQHDADAERQSARSNDPAPARSRSHVEAGPDPYQAGNHQEGAD